MPVQNLYKFIMIGESSVGKTCILMQYVESVFRESFLTTVGVDFRIKEIEIDGKKIKLQLWDTAGQEQFHTITKSYFRGAHGILLVYDSTNQQSFEQTKMWMDSIHETTDNVDIVLIANKIDLPDRTVSTEEGEALAKEFQCPYFETSAKTGEGINEAFIALAKIVKERKDKEPTSNSQKVTPTPQPSQRNNNCC